MFSVRVAPDGSVRTCPVEVRVTEVPLVNAPGSAPLEQNPDDQVSAQPPVRVAERTVHPAQSRVLTLEEQVVRALEKAHAEEIFTSCGSKRPRSRRSIASIATKGEVAPSLEVACCPAPVIADSEIFDAASGPSESVSELRFLHDSSVIKIRKI